MTRCLFVSDLHGRLDRYDRLFRTIERERPRGVFLGGDLFPGLLALPAVPDLHHETFVEAVLARRLRELRARLGDDYPCVFVILGNDDGRAEEGALRALDAEGLLVYAHDRRRSFGRYGVYGYAYVPPTPQHLKDWERYDVSRYVDPGCVSPEEGRRTVPVSPSEARYATIAEDLERLVGEEPMEHAVFLFHTPPYDTNLDRAALDGRAVDHVPLDVHVGSVAVRRFIERRQPWITLHGHVHESTRLTGAWSDRIERTHCFGAAHDGPELCVVRLELERPERATRELLG